MCLYADGSSCSCSTGQWAKSEDGMWRFDRDHGVLEQFVDIRQNKPINSLIGLVREEFVIGLQTPLLLTYQLPPWMLVPNGARAPSC